MDSALACCAWLAGVHVRDRRRLMRRLATLRAEQLVQQGDCRLVHAPPGRPRRHVATRTPAGYWRIHLKVDSGGRKVDFTVYVHVLSWCLHHLPRLAGAPPGAAVWAWAWEAAAVQLAATTPSIISHLCHRRDCSNALHLSRESQSVNDDRRRCVEAGACRTHGRHPRCLL